MNLPHRSVTCSANTGHTWSNKFWHDCGVESPPRPGRGQAASLLWTGFECKGKWVQEIQAT